MTADTASEVATGLYPQPRPKQCIVFYFGWSVRAFFSQWNHKNISVNKLRVTAFLSFIQRYKQFSSIEKILCSLFNNNWSSYNNIYTVCFHNNACLSSKYDSNCWCGSTTNSKFGRYSYTWYKQDGDKLDYHWRQVDAIKNVMLSDNHIARSKTGTVLLHLLSCCVYLCSSSAKSRYLFFDIAKW